MLTKKKKQKNDDDVIENSFGDRSRSVVCTHFWNEHQKKRGSGTKQYKH